MWDDPRLLAAIAALPAEAFIKATPKDAELHWRRAARRLHEDQSEPAPGHVAPVVGLSAPDPTGHDAVSVPMRDAVSVPMRPDWTPRRQPADPPTG
jgi:hypothetical protein